MSNEDYFNIVGITEKEVAYSKDTGIEEGLKDISIEKELKRYNLIEFSLSEKIVLIFSTLSTRAINLPNIIAYLRLNGNLTPERIEIIKQSLRECDKKSLTGFNYTTATKIYKGIKSDRYYNYWINLKTSEIYYFRSSNLMLEKENGKVQALMTFEELANLYTDTGTANSKLLETTIHIPHEYMLEKALNKLNRTEELEKLAFVVNQPKHDMFNIQTKIRWS